MPDLKIKKKIKPFYTDILITAGAESYFISNCNYVIFNFILCQNSSKALKNLGIFLRLLCGLCGLLNFVI